MPPAVRSATINIFSNPQQEPVYNAAPSSAKIVTNVRQICALSALPASSCRTGSVQLVPPTARSATPVLNVFSVQMDTTLPSIEAVFPARAHV